LLCRVFRVQCLCNRHEVSRIESGNRGKAQGLGVWRQRGSVPLYILTILHLFTSGRTDV
jgi:hypothetical protein